MATEQQLDNRKEFEKAKDKYHELMFRYLPDNTIKDFDFKELHDTICKDIGVKFDQLLSLGQYKIEKDLLVQNGYIVYVDYMMRPDVFTMTDKGVTAKKLGGHEGYEKFIKQQLNINNYQRKVNWALIIVGLLAVLVPTFFELEKHYHFIWQDTVQPTYEIQIKDTLIVQPTHSLDSLILLYNTKRKKKRQQQK